MTGPNDSGGRRPCRACGAELVFALTPTGSAAPVTMEPRDHGNVLLFRGLEGEMRCAQLDPGIAATLKSQGVPLRLNHFADCPERDRFKKPAPEFGVPAELPEDAA